MSSPAPIHDPIPTICANEHERIVHRLDYCPLCNALDKMVKLEEQIASLKDELLTRENEITTLRENMHESLREILR